MATTNHRLNEKDERYILEKKERERERDVKRDVSSSSTIWKNKKSHQEQGDRSFNIGIKFLQI